MVDENEILQCEFKRHDLNIINNLIVCMHERKAFKVDEFGRVAKVWEKIRKILGFPLDNLDIPELELRNLKLDKPKMEEIPEEKTPEEETIEEETTD